MDIHCHDVPCLDLPNQGTVGNLRKAVRRPRKPRRRQLLGYADQEQHDARQQQACHQPASLCPECLQQVPSLQGACSSPVQDRSLLVQHPTPCKHEEWETLLLAAAAGTGPGNEPSSHSCPRTCHGSHLDLTAVSDLRFPRSYSGAEKRPLLFEQPPSPDCGA
jgi:hypothetical protein